MIRKLRCFLGLHFGYVDSDPSGLWFQCAYCKHRSGMVPRAELDKQLDRELRK